MNKAITGGEYIDIEKLGFRLNHVSESGLYLRNSGHRIPERSEQLTSFFTLSSFFDSNVYPQETTTWDVMQAERERRRHFGEVIFEKGIIDLRGSFSCDDMPLAYEQARIITYKKLSLKPEISLHAYLPQFQTDIRVETLFCADCQVTRKTRVSHQFLKRILSRSDFGPRINLWADKKPMFVEAILPTEYFLTDSVVKSLHTQGIKRTIS